MKKYNKVKGDEGEEIACDYLRKNCYKIICRNYKTYLGEIDIIAVKDNCIHFIEVKLRNSRFYGGGVEAVNYYKRQHIEKVAKQYIALNEIVGMQIQFDVIEITKYKDKYYGKHYKQMLF